MVLGHALEVEPAGLGAGRILERLHVVIRHHPVHAVIHARHAIAVHRTHVDVPILQPALHLFDLGLLRIPDLLSQFGDLRVDVTLRENHLRHLEGLLMMRNHHGCELDVGHVEAVTGRRRVAIRHAAVAAAVAVVAVAVAAHHAVARRASNEAEGGDDERRRGEEISFTEHGCALLIERRRMPGCPGIRATSGCW